MAEARVGIRPLLQDAEYKSAVQHLVQFTVQMLGGVTEQMAASSASGGAAIGASVKQTTSQVKSALKEQVQLSLSAQEAIEASEKKMQSLRVKYEHDAGKKIIDDMKKMQDEKASILHAMTLTTDKEAKAELAARKKEYDEELRLLKQVALEKKDIQEEGAGAKAGILGTGRKIVGGAASGVGSGIGGSLGSMVMGGALGAGLMSGFEKLHEQAAIADNAADTLSIAFTKAGKSGKDLEDSLTDADKAAVKISDDFAMPKHEVQALQATIVGFGNITGNQLHQLTEISIGASNALGMNAESVAKLIAKGADPEQEAQLKKLGIEFDKSATAADRMRIIQEKLGPAVQATKESTHDAMGAFDRMKNKLMEVAIGFADKAFSALQPVFEALMSVLEAVMPLVDALTPILAELAGMIGENAKELALALIPLLQELIPIVSFVAHVLAEVLKIALGVVVFAFKELVGIVTETIKWIKDAVDTIKNAATAITDFIGITNSSEVKAKVSVEQKVEQKVETSASASPNQPVSTEAEKHDRALEFMQKQQEKHAVKMQKTEESAAKRREKQKQEAFNREKQIIEEAHKEELIQLELSLANHEIKEDDFKRVKLKKEIAFNEKLAEVARNHEQRDSQFRLNAAKGRADFRTYELSDDLEALQQKYDKEKDLLTDKLDNELITEEEYKVLEIKLKEDQLNERIALLKKHQQDASKEEKTKEEAQKELEREQAKQARALQKEKIKIEEELKRKEIEEMEDGAEKALKLQQLQYDEELKQLRASIKNKEALKLAELKAEEENKRKVQEINLKYQQEEEQKTRAFQVRLFDFFSQGADQKRQKAKEFASQELLGLDAQFLNQTGVVKKYLFMQLQNYLISKWAEAGIVAQTEAAKTGAQNAGIAARVAGMAVEVGKNAISAASSAYTAVANAIRWIFTTFPFPISAAIAAAAPVAIYGMFQGARKLFKFKDGGITQGARMFSFGENGEHTGLFGEDRSSKGEAFIPLEKMPMLLNDMGLMPKPAYHSGSALGSQDLLPLINKLEKIHTAIKSEKPPVIMDSYGNYLSQEQAKSVVNSRRF